MKADYSFVKPKGFSFFDEGSSFDGDVDLLGFEYDKDSCHGMLDRVIEESRGVLAGVPSNGVRAILWLGDAALDEILDRVQLIGGNGEHVARDHVDLSRVNHAALIPLILRPISTNSVAIGDPGEVEDAFQISPERFCAAYALRMAFNATREYVKHDEDGLQEYYLMQASFAYGLMSTFVNAGPFSISGAVSASVSHRKSRDLAGARWSSDPKGAAMADVRLRYMAMIEGRAAHRSDAQFAREMMKDFGALLSEGGIKNAISRWRRAK